MNSAFEIIDHQRFRPYLVANARVELLHSGTRWAEGPVWIADMQALLWSDVPGNCMLRWVEGQPASVYRAASNHATATAGTAKAGC